MSATGHGDLLATIVAATRRTVDVRRQRVSLAALNRDAGARVPAGPAFYDALARPGTLNVIAECKRRSPSKGVLCVDYDPVAIATGYAAAGAAAISVLTEPTFFDGALEHLAAIRAAVAVPLLRKDFIVDEYQILEARASGADAILLIVAALEPALLRRLLAAAHAHGLAALVEVHDEQEIDRALDAEARLIGVNNRNLRTLAVSLEASERAIARIPAHVTAVAESGLRSHEDLRRLASLGYRAFLVGERLMTSPDPGRALAELLNGTPADAGQAGA
jgi:indole-3-glycerol phosphate synthase